MILGIDPGTHESAAVLYDGARVLWARMYTNAVLTRRLMDTDWKANHVAIENFESFGKPVGREVFQTVVWIGRFVQAVDGIGLPWSLIYRSQVKLALCNSRTAKDSFVRQALLDKFGPGKRAAVGLKKSPGPLYQVHGHCWQALAVAVVAEMQMEATV